MSTLLQGASGLPGGYGIVLLQSLLALGAVCVLAWVVLRWGSRWGLAGTRRGRVKVVERVALDRRRSLYLVEVGRRVLLLGASDGAAPSMLAELDPDELPSISDESTGFAELVEKFRRSNSDRAR